MPVILSLEARQPDAGLLPLHGPQAGEVVDILHSAFAIHHLDDGAKAAVLTLMRSRIRPLGLVLWADVFREPVTADRPMGSAASGG